MNTHTADENTWACHSKEYQHKHRLFIVELDNNLDDKLKTSNINRVSDVVETQILSLSLPKRKVYNFKQRDGRKMYKCRVEGLKLKLETQVLAEVYLLTTEKLQSRKDKKKRFLIRAGQNQKDHDGPIANANWNGSMTFMKDVSCDHVEDRLNFRLKSYEKANG